MYFTIEKTLESIIYFIIGIKILFLLSAIGSIFFKYYKHDSTTSEILDTKFSYWKDQTEFIYITSMALLLLFIFNPWYKHQKYIDEKMRFLFFLFGIVLIITAKWGIFIKESHWYQKISNSLK